LAILLLNVNFGSAANSCSVTTESNCIGSGQVVLKLSGMTNAQAALKTGSDFSDNKVLCCDFGSGGTICTGTNKFLGLSSSSNAHGEDPERTTYNTNACYSVSDCKYKGSDCGSKTEMIRLPSDGNAHLGNVGDNTYVGRICCTVVADPRSILVTSPNLGTENWQIDSQQTITWSSSPVGAIANVKIEISRDNGLTWDSPLFTSTTNDGTESWIVTGVTTVQALIRITDVLDVGVKDQSDAPFTISSPVGSGCTITDAYWEVGGVEITEENVVIAGNVANPVAVGSSSADCDGATALFSVLENSGAGPISQQPASATFANGVARGTWTTEYVTASGYSKYYFIAIQGSSALSSEVAGNALLKVFTASGIAMCSNYLDSEVCVDDPSGVGQDSCGPETTDCECSWNSESSLCQGVGLGGLCRYSSETLGEATCEAGDQFIEIRVTGTWSGARPDPQGLDLKCETPVTRVLECPAQIALPFFGIYGILITVLLVVGVYGVLSLRSNRRKSRKR
ncbi:MAG: hypothetical protein KKC96_02195, partial [Nanoarchaeota archaeon]|nr:hypothetical protein [Nanoarchaeota archaeon]